MPGRGKAATSGYRIIVAGNVKEEGMRLIEQFGPFEIHGDQSIMQALDTLLRAFVDQRRMKMVGEYHPLLSGGCLIGYWRQQ